MPEKVEHNAVIKVYYVRNLEKTGYNIEYYYNNEIDNSKTEQVEAQRNEVITREAVNEKIEANKVNGYKLFAVLNVPLKTVEEMAENVVKIHYTSIEEDPENPSNPEGKEKIGYKIEYYYDGEIDNTKSEVIEVEKNTKISKEDLQEKIEANEKENYKFFTLLNIPLKVSEDTENNVIKVHYTSIKKDPENPDEPIVEEKAGYKIEYYYDNKIDTVKTEIIEAEKDSIVSKERIQEKIDSNAKEGYELLTLLNMPLKVSDNVENNVIKVHYAKIENNPENPEQPVEKIIYKLEYYFDNLVDNRKTQIIEANKEDIVTEEMLQESIATNLETGYELFTILNLPLKVSDNIENNVIKVHYASIEKDPENPDLPVEEKVAYRIEYYYENEIDRTKTELIEAAKEDRKSVV